MTDNEKFNQLDKDIVTSDEVKRAQETVKRLIEKASNATSETIDVTGMNKEEFFKLLDAL